MSARTVTIKEIPKHAVSQQMTIATTSARQMFAREIVEVPVAEEMSESFLAYSLSVITSRAIPDVRDGLKPVQRRILWSMLQMGVRPATPFRKSARIVGDTMGRYHPHGDTTIYDTLTRMGQDFARIVPLIDPQGNFGSLDDPPAAARYTECRLSAAAMDMVRELSEGTVEFRPTYDGEDTEPVVLPALLPNILVNGTSGIAVGMTTNMAPHNLREVAAAINLVMRKRRPRPSIDELMEVLPGPDFPSGGIIVDDGLHEAYETGRGSFRIRARTHIEQVTRARQAIIVTELPYLVGPERVLARVSELVRVGRLASVVGVVDLSDINGLKIRIDLKPYADTRIVLSELYRLTPLEETFGINNVVLVDGVPTTLGIYDLCHHYIRHRLEVVVRRTQHRLGRAEARLHILEGLLIALDAIDEVVAIVRGSRTTTEACSALMERFELSDVQANHILDMQLRRFTALAKLELESEARDLRTDIDGYRLLLGSENRQRTLVLKELRQVVEAHGVERRSEIIDAGDIEVVEVPETTGSSTDSGSDEPGSVTLSTSGHVGRVALGDTRRGAVGRHDLIVSRLFASAGSMVAAITSQGRALIVSFSAIPDGTRRARGIAAARLFGLNKAERVLTILTDSKQVPQPMFADVSGIAGIDTDELVGEDLVVVTAEGMIKRLVCEEVFATSSDGSLIALKDDDRVVAAFEIPAGRRLLGDVDFMVVADDGQALRFPAASIPVRSRGAAGIIGFRCRNSARVVVAGAVTSDSQIIVYTSARRVKATSVDEFDTKKRGGQGVRIAKLVEGESIMGGWIGDPSATNLFVQMADDQDPKKLDPYPVEFGVQANPRGRAPSRIDRQIKVIAPARW